MLLFFSIQFFLHFFFIYFPRIIFFSNEIGKVSSLSHQVKELSVLNNSSSLEIIELNDQLILLENMKKDYINSLLETKKAYKIHNEKKIEIEKKIIADDKIYRLKEMADIRQQWIRDQTLDRDHDLFKQQRAIEFALTDNQNKKNNLKLKEVLAKTTDFKYPKRDNCSQTGTELYLNNKKFSTFSFLFYSFFFFFSLIISVFFQILESLYSCFRFLALSFLIFHFMINIIFFQYLSNNLLYYMLLKFTSVYCNLLEKNFC